MSTRSTAFNFGDRVRHTKRPEWGIGVVTKTETVSHDGETVQRLHIRFAAAGMKVLNTAVASIESVKDGGTATQNGRQIVAGGQVVVRGVANRATRKAGGSRNIRRMQSASRPNAAGNFTPNNANTNGHTPPRDRASADAQPKRPNGVRNAVQNNGGKKITTNTNGWLADLERQNPKDALVSIPETARDPFLSVWDRLIFTLNLYRFTKTPKAITEWAIAQSGMVDPLSEFTRQELELLHDRWIRNLDHHLVGVVEEAEKSDPNRAKETLEAVPLEARGAVKRLNYNRR